MKTPRPLTRSRPHRTAPPFLLLAGALVALAITWSAHSGSPAGASPEMPVLREVDVRLTFPDQPGLGMLTVTMFLPETAATPALLAAGREAVLARFPGSFEVVPGEVQAQYRTDGVRWPQPSASWRYNPYEASPRIGADDAFAAIGAGANGWTNAGGSGFQYHFDGYTGTPPGCDGIVGNVPRDGENVVGWGHIADGFWGFTCWWTSGETVEGTSHMAMTEFDIVFESGSNVPYSSRVLKALALHEFGHALGLAHAQAALCPGSVMCGGAGATILQSLTPDDVHGVVSLYGVTASTTPTPVQTPSPVPTPTPFPPGSRRYQNWAPALSRD